MQRRHYGLVGKPRRPRLKARYVGGSTSSAGYASGVLPLGGAGSVSDLGQAVDVKNTHTRRLVPGHRRATDAEKRAAIATSALTGLRVADVMTADPQVAQGWITVQDFFDHIAAWPWQDAFPVVDWDGTFIGVVVIDLLARIPPGDWTRLRLDRVALAVSPPCLAVPEDQPGHCWPTARWVAT